MVGAKPLMHRSVCSDTPLYRGLSGRCAWSDSPWSLGHAKHVGQACADSCARDVLSTRPGCPYSSFCCFTAPHTTTDPAHGWPADPPAPPCRPPLGALYGRVARTGCAVAWQTGVGYPPRLGVLELKGRGTPLRSPPGSGGAACRDRAARASRGSGAAMRRTYAGVTSWRTQAAGVRARRHAGCRGCMRCPHLGRGCTPHAAPSSRSGRGRQADAARGSATLRSQ
jgi:hypothetical protein